MMFRESPSCSPKACRLNVRGGESGGGRGRETYLELVLVQEILITLPAAEEQDNGTNLFATGSQCGTLLDETTEWRNTGTRANHNNGTSRIRRQLEVGVTNMDRNMDTIIFIARAVDRISQTVRIRRRVTILFLLESKQVVRGNTLDHMRSSRKANGLNDSSNTDLVLLDQTRRRDRIVTGLKLVKAFDQQGERNGSERLGSNALESLSNVEALVRDLLVEVVLVASKTHNLRLGFLVRSEGCQSSDELTRHRSADFHVVANSRVVSSRGRDGNLGSNIDAFDIDNRVTFSLETENLEEPVDLSASISGPDSNMITSLIREVASGNVDFHVQAVTVLDGE